MMSRMLFGMLDSRDHGIPRNKTSAPRRKEREREKTPSTRLLSFRSSPAGLHSRPEGYDAFTLHPRGWRETETERQRASEHGPLDTSLMARKISPRSASKLHRGPSRRAAQGAPVLIFSLAAMYVFLHFAFCCQSCQTLRAECC